MSEFIKYFVIFIGFSFLFAVAYFAYGIWRSAEDAAYLSCTASIATEIQKIDKAKSLLEQNKDWKILNEEEVNSLMSQIHGHDCGKYSNQTLDMWNHRINIALRKPKDRIEIIIWSNGSDNISGTSDDLIFPFEAQVPK